MKLNLIQDKLHYLHPCPAEQVFIDDLGNTTIQGHIYQGVGEVDNWNMGIYHCLHSLMESQ